MFVFERTVQIQLLSSDVFVMLRPVQAHSAAVICINNMAEVDERGKEVYRSVRMLVSAGLEGVIKVWRLLCSANRTVSPAIDINLQLVVQARTRF